MERAEQPDLERAEQQPPGPDYWYETVREATLRLVRVRSVSPSAAETDASREALRLLHEGGLADAYTLSGLDPIEGDPLGRQNAYAFLRGRDARTVVLFGHLDTVDTADYGRLEPWALDPDALAARQDKTLDLPPEALADLRAQPGDWMFARGVADMKSGVAAAIAVMRHLARLAPDARPPLSVVLLATLDEENESAGIIQGVRLLQRLRERNGLAYVGAINTDYTSAHYPGDPHRYIYTGTIGKLLPCFLVIGSAAHAGAPFDGLDANLLAAELVRDLSMNADLCDADGGIVTPPPVTLHAGDLKVHYDTQIPFAACVYLNVLTLTTTPATLLARLRPRAEAALARVLGYVNTAARRWSRIGQDVSATPAERTGAVMTYAELFAATVERHGRERVLAELAAEWERWPATLDKRERSLHLVQRLWALGGRQGPAIVMYYAPPYYPHVAPAPSSLHGAVAAVVRAHPELNLALGSYFPLLSDMSYLRLGAGVDLAALRDNMPVWQEVDGPVRPGAYALPLAAMRALNCPVVNLGPYGRGVHRRDERVLMSYSFGQVPRLIVETIEHLAHLESGA